MKKVVLKLIIFICLIFLIRWLFVCFKGNHSIDYILTTKNNSYKINEKFDDNSNNYYFEVKDRNNNKYLFSTINKYDKSRKIISDIRLYKNDNLSCILPIYNKSRGDLACVYNKRQVSYSYLKETDNKEINNINKLIRKDGYLSIDEYDYSEVKEKMNNYYFYKDNIPNDTIFTMWFYKGFYVVSSDDIVRMEYFKKDKYENNLSLLIDSKYVFVNTDNGLLDYDEVNIYDVVNGKKKTISLENSISNGSYFNGVCNGLLYVTDANKKMQYSIDISKGSSSVVGNRESGFVGDCIKSKEKVSTSSFFKDKVYFDEVKIDSKFKKLGAREVKVDKDIYYYIDSDNNVYMLYSNHFDYPILLFKLDTISDWKVGNGGVIVVSDDTLYYYDNMGLRKILVNSELNYNSNNICDFMKKVG